MNKKAVIFDTETTSIDAKTGGICQLSYIVVDISNGTIGDVLKAKNYYFAVDFINPNAERVHGLSTRKLFTLSEGIRFSDVAEDIMEDFDADVFIGHNIQFDKRFINAEFVRNELVDRVDNTFCTMNHYKNILKLTNVRGGLKAPKLEETINFLKISPRTISNKAIELFGGFSGYHDARYDTVSTLLLLTEGIEQGYIEEDFLENI
jgi:DNA polymerase-3 subunit epsilon